MLVAAPPSVGARPRSRTSTRRTRFRAIVNAHFRIAPPAGQPAILGVVNGLIEWLFAFPDRLSVTISGADGCSTARARSWPRTSGARSRPLTGLPADLPPWQIVKEKRATFAATPEQNAKRPPALTRCAKSRARRRLDADRTARDDRRRGPFGL